MQKSELQIAAFDLPDGCSELVEEGNEIVGVRTAGDGIYFFRLIWAQNVSVDGAAKVLVVSVVMLSVGLHAT